MAVETWRCPEKEKEREKMSGAGEGDEQEGKKSILNAIAQAAMWPLLNSMLVHPLAL
jgi:hypothetical protein